MTKLRDRLGLLLTLSAALIVLALTQTDSPLPFWQGALIVSASILGVYLLRARY